jgi:outer membrane protein assembly factor BamE (lipoprotein component of BamABCDE complex)
MKRILISLATTFVATTLLVACNGSFSEGNTPAPPTFAKAVCTSSANWSAVRIGMTLSEVEDVLGKPDSRTTTTSTTDYTYDSCRGFVTAVNATTGATTGIDVGGSVSWSTKTGVTSIVDPKRITTAIFCELDYYTYPKNSGVEVCRTAQNPF